MDVRVVEVDDVMRMSEPIASDNSAPTESFVSVTVVSKCVSEIADYSLI
jgi:hypothetical protein